MLLHREICKLEEKIARLDDRDRATVEALIDSLLSRAVETDAADAEESLVEDTDYETDS